MTTDELLIASKRNISFEDTGTHTCTGLIEHLSVPCRCLVPSNRAHHDGLGSLLWELQSGAAVTNGKVANLKRDAVGTRLDNVSGRPGIHVVHQVVGPRAQLHCIDWLLGAMRSSET